MAVSAVWRLPYLLAPCPAEPWNTPTHTGETRCAPLLKSKSMLLLGLLVREIPGVDPGRGHYEGAGIAHRREQTFFLAKFAEPVPLCLRK